jgi:hypothetical protein
MQESGPCLGTHNKCPHCNLAIFRDFSSVGVGKCKQTGHQVRLKTCECEKIYAKTPSALPSPSSGCDFFGCDGTSVCKCVSASCGKTFCQNHADYAKARVCIRCRKEKCASNFITITQVERDTTKDSLTNTTKICCECARLLCAAIKM